MIYILLFQPKTFINFWVGGVSVPSGKCGFLSSRSANIQEYNCMNMLPFVCEKGMDHTKYIIWTWMWIIHVNFIINIAICACTSLTYNVLSLLGTKPYQEPFLWRGAGLAVILASVIMTILLGVLIVGCWLKSRRRKKQFFERKNSLRTSIRSV